MKKRRTAFICAAVCLALVSMPFALHAASTAEALAPISTSAECSLAVSYTYEGVGFAGARVNLYKIADVSSDYIYTLTEDFAPTRLQLNGVATAGEWDTVRTTLETYVAASGTGACASICTDEAGRATFRDLAPGMYLVSSVQCSSDGFRYYFASTLTALPGLAEDGTWNYDVDVRPKSVADDPTGDDVEYKVLKLWKDGEKASARPTSVEVDILRNGERVKTVTLSGKNNWSYSWYAEDDGSEWLVSEKNVPDGYVMTVEKRTATFTIVNSVPDAPPPAVSETGDSANLWLYVLLICLSGVVLVAVGLAGRRREE